MSAGPAVIGVLAGGHHNEAAVAALTAVDWLQQHDLQVRVDPDLATAAGLARGGSLFEADLIVVFGGDGTVVGTARQASARGVPVIGVNFGTFGFLAEIDPADLAIALEAIASGDYRVESCLMLEACVTDPDGQEIHCAVAANDVTVKAQDPGHVLRLRLRSDGELIAEFPADGLIVATPTGSTAYNLSAGGPVVVPGVEAMVITPICPHTLATRPLVINSQATITVEVVDDRPDQRWALVSFDGQINLELHGGTCLTVRQAATRLLMARLRASSFFDSLRGKLRWGTPK